jgi:hypothetical protein
MIQTPSNSTMGPQTTYQCGVGLTAARLQQNAVILTAKRRALEEESAGTSHDSTRQQKDECDNDDNNWNKKLAFLYGQESNRYGEGVPPSDSLLTAEMNRIVDDRFEAQKMRKLLLVNMNMNMNMNNDFKNSPKQTTATTNNNNKNNKNVMTQEEVKKVLAQYTHNPKQEDLLYSTESNVYGSQMLTPATFTSTKMTRSQQFSSSFPILPPDDY